MRRLLPLLVLLTALLPIAAAAAEETRVFRLQHRLVGEAATVVEPLLSPSGSITIRPKRNELEVTDTEDAIDSIVKVLEAWDLPTRPGRQYRIRVSLLMAQTEEGTSPLSLSPDDAKVWREITKLFPYYKSVESLDTIRVTAADGSTVESASHRWYLLRFTLKAKADNPRRVVLSPFEVVRVNVPGGLSTPTLEKCNVSLDLGQTQVLFVNSGGGTSKSLVVVFLLESGEGL